MHAPASERQLFVNLFAAMKFHSGLCGAGHADNLGARSASSMGVAQTLGQVALSRVVQGRAFLSEMAAALPGAPHRREVGRGVLIELRHRRHSTNRPSALKSKANGSTTRLALT
jgi:hypothetical protein